MKHLSDRKNQVSTLNIQELSNNLLIKTYKQAAFQKKRCLVSQNHHQNVSNNSNTK